MNNPEDHSEDGIYFTAKMTTDGMTLKMTIVKEGQKISAPIKLAPSDKEIRKFLELFYAILDKATLEGSTKNRIIKYLEGGLDEFLKNS